MKKVLVTGGTGLVGGNLIRRLVEKDYQVRALVRENSNTMAFDDLPVEHVKGDLLHRDSIEKAVKGMDIVFHCAAMVSMWRHKEELMEKVNVDGTRAVVQACCRHSVERLLHISTVDAIGFNTPEGYGTLSKPSTEEVPYQNEWMKIPYGKTKWQAQEVVLEAVKEENLDAVILNPAYMLGPYDVKPTSGRMILEVARGKAWGYTSGGNNVLHVRDAVEAMINAIDMGKKGEMYILGNENLTYRELFGLVAEVVGVSPPKFPLPYPLAKIVGWGGDLYGWITGREPAISSGEIFMGYQPHYFSAKKARRELDLPSTPVKEAIEDAYQWFQNEGYID